MIKEEIMRILVVSGFDINSSQPNAICVKNLLSEFDKDNEISYEIVGQDCFDKVPMINWKKSIIFSAKRIFKWPSTNPDAETAIYNDICSIANVQPFDAIFVIHKPYEAVRAACRYKKKNNNISLFVYCLDPIANEIDASLGLGRNLFWLTKRAELQCYRISDLIIQMNCNRRKYNSSRYKKFHDKFCYTDFPLILFDDSIENKEKCGDEDSIKLIYSGVLDSVYRSPEYLLKLLCAANNTVPLSIDFYSRGNCEELIKLCPVANAKGYVPNADLQRELKRADIMVNIGNKFSEMLPSKLLTYFMSGKPIIHISNQENDSCIEYLKKYPLSLIIYEKDSIDFNVNKLEEFLKSVKGKNVPNSEILNSFIENTPEYSYRVLKEAFLSRI